MKVENQVKKAHIIKLKRSDEKKALSEKRQSLTKKRT